MQGGVDSLYLILTAAPRICLLVRHQPQLRGQRGHHRPAKPTFPVPCTEQDRPGNVGRTQAGTTPQGGERRHMTLVDGTAAKRVECAAELPPNRHQQPPPNISSNSVNQMQIWAL